MTDSKNIQLKAGNLILTLERWYQEDHGSYSMGSGTFSLTDITRIHAEVIVKKGKKVIWKWHEIWNARIPLEKRACEIRALLLEKGVTQEEIETKLPHLTKHCSGRM